MARCDICNHCGMCVSKVVRPAAVAHGNGMISLDADTTKEECAFCATPLDILYD